MGIIKSNNKIRFVYGREKKSQSCEINKNYSNGKAREEVGTYLYGN